MVRHTIKCSQCDETFPDGFEYRMHWEKHFDEFLNKQKMSKEVQRRRIHFFLEENIKEVYKECNKDLKLAVLKDMIKDLDKDEKEL